MSHVWLAFLLDWYGQGLGKLGSGRDMGISWKGGEEGLPGGAIPEGCLLEGEG